MYEFKHEFERREKIYKIYLILFVITVLINIFINFFDFGIGKFSETRVVISLLFWGIIFYFGLCRKIWAEVMIKFFVWLNIILLFMIIIVKILGL